MTTGSKTRRKPPETSARYSVLTIERLQGLGPLPIAVLLLDSYHDELYIRFREDLADVAEAEELDVLEGMADTIMARAHDEGATQLFDWFLETLSGYVRIEDPHALPVPADWKRAVDLLFDENVTRSHK
jgi:hypothetical protein